MENIAETIQETVEQTGRNKTNSMVAICVAVTATFMALCNVKDGNVVQAMSQAQAHYIDAWSYFQAKSTKQENMRNTLDLLKQQNGPDKGALITKYEAEINRYEKEKATIKAEAEGYQKEYDAINMYDDQFDMTDALLTIAIAMFGITALTQKRWLLYFSMSASTIGIILGMAAFMKISIHSDFISKILG